jgi:hypothetical protein
MFDCLNSLQLSGFSNNLRVGRLKVTRLCLTAMACLCQFKLLELGQHGGCQVLQAIGFINELLVGRSAVQSKASAVCRCWRGEVALSGATMRFLVCTRYYHCCLGVQVHLHAAQCLSTTVAR